MDKSNAVISTHPKRPGRKRDPLKEQALLGAALDVYSETGWATFTFEAVARRSGVGKPAIYLRWNSREELLLDALGSLDLPDVNIDTGSLRGDLEALADALLAWWLSPGAQVWQRLQLDHAVCPELTESFYRVHVRRDVRAAEGIVDRAVARGELRSRADGIVLLEMVNGATFTRVFDTPPARRPAVAASASAYVKRLADLTTAAAQT